MEKLIRQGDVLFIPVEDKNNQQNPLNHGIIARGAHTHMVEPEDKANACLYSSWEGSPRFISVQAPVRIIHEEHATVTLPAGFYQINRAREFDRLAGMARMVLD